MNHLSEGQLQAFLDGEVEGAAARSLAVHLEACAVCTDTLAGMRATAVRVSHALAWLDRPASTAAAIQPGITALAAERATEVVGANDDADVLRIDAHRSWGRPARVGFLKAAMLALLVTSAAAAAIPGSPVQRWLIGAWDQLTRPDPVSVQEPDAPGTIGPATAPATSTELASISIEPVDGRLTVLLDGAERVQSIRVVLVDAPTATVETEASAATRFSTGPSRIQATGLGSGVVHVLLPRSLAYASIVADGQTLLQKEGTTLQTPGDVVERSDNVIVFRAP
ncbi:MAG TPA: zf-HC2 domain-containing protein [Longimicrobiales bacterium]|nr:zf-HC2 domain-containing protein [Longimicrobiales bacterium]